MEKNKFQRITLNSFILTYIYLQYLFIVFGRGRSLARAHFHLTSLARDSEDQGSSNAKNHCLNTTTALRVLCISQCALHFVAFLYMI